jgi:hypothetical protein
MVGVAATFGALLLGSFVAIFLSGTNSVQCYLYYKTYHNDSRRTKTLVSVIWLLDILHSCLVVVSIWHYLIVKYGQQHYIDVIPKTLALSIACTAIITISVHCFFAHRIYMFSRGNIYLTSAVVILAVFRLCAASVTTGEMIRLGSFRMYKAHYSWVFTLGLGLSSTVDVLITASLCYFLRASRTKSTKLNTIIDSLFLYTVENGAITSAATILSMIFWLTMNSNLIFMGLHFVIAKFYAASLLATLHARQKLRKKRSASSRGPGATTGMAPVTFLRDDTQGRPNYPRIVPGHARQASESTSSPTTLSSLPSPKVQISVIQTVQCNADGDEEKHDESSSAEEEDIDGNADIYAMDTKGGDLENGQQ